MPDPRNLDADAVDCILRRIQIDPEARYLFGIGTDSFERLCAARAARDGITSKDVERAVLRPPQSELGETRATRYRARLGRLEEQITELGAVPVD